MRSASRTTLPLLASNVRVPILSVGMVVLVCASAFPIIVHLLAVVEPLIYGLCKPISPSLPAHGTGDLQATVFGQPQPEWIVEHVYVAAGIEHARLGSAANSGERRTLSLYTLPDWRRF